jgi:hypothetical protein
VTKLTLTISTLYLALVGLALMFFPIQFGRGAVPADAAPELLALLRLLGGPFLGIAVLNWLSRNAEPSTLRVVMLANIVGFGAVAANDIWGVVSGEAAGHRQAIFGYPSALHIGLRGGSRSRRQTLRFCTGARPQSHWTALPVSSLPLRLLNQNFRRDVRVHDRFEHLLDRLADEHSGLGDCNGSWLAVLCGSGACRDTHTRRALIASRTLLAGSGYSAAALRNGHPRQPPAVTASLIRPMIAVIIPRKFLRKRRHPLGQSELMQQRRFR